MTNQPRLKTKPKGFGRVRALAIGCAGLLILSACSTTTPEATPTKEAAQPSANIDMGTTSKLGTTNPLDQTWSSYVFAVFDGMLAWGSEKPGLAESWSAPTPKSLVFKLRSGAKFHDGTPVTGEDVAFTINLVKEKNYGFVQNLDTFESVVAEGNQVTVNFTHPDPLGLVKIGQIPIIPEAYWKAKGEEGFVAAPIGAGPFKVVSYSPGVKVDLERFDDYWGEKAKTKTVSLNFYTDAQALESAFESGQLQVAHALPATAVPQLDANKKFVVSAGYVGGTTMLQINTTKPPFDDPNLRKAANLAINQDALIKALDYGSAEPEAGQVTYPGVLGYVPSIKEIPQDMKEAKKLVAASKYDGTVVNIVGLAIRKNLFEGIAASLTEAGFKVNVEVLDVPVWLKQFRGGSDANILQRGVSYQGINDASRAYRWFTWSSKPFVTDPKWISLWDDINTEMDPTKRKALLEKATKMVHDQNYVLFTSSTPSVNATVKGVDGITWLNPAMDFRQVQWIPAK